MCEQTLDASSKFSSMFKKANVKKEYLAICHGDPGFDSVIDVPLYRRSSGKVGAVSKSQAAQYRARDAQTRVRNVASSSGERRVIEADNHVGLGFLIQQGCKV